MNDKISIITFRSLGATMSNPSRELVERKVDKMVWERLSQIGEEFGVNLNCMSDSEPKEALNRRKELIEIIRESSKRFCEFCTPTS